MIVVRGTLPAVLVLAVMAAPASAEDSDRGVHGGVGAGVYGAITGSERTGSFADVVIYPGGVLGRFGIRAGARGLGRVSPNVFLGGITYEAGAARPTLQIGLYATAGGTLDGLAAGALGVQAQLAALGPVGIGADLSGLLVLDGTQDTELLLTAALTFRVTR